MDKRRVIIVISLILVVSKIAYGQNKWQVMMTEAGADYYQIVDEIEEELTTDSVNEEGSEGGLNNQYAKW